MGKFIDLTNQIFNDICVDEYLGSSMWRCHCLKCGTRFQKRTTQVKRFGCDNCWKAHVNSHYFDTIDTPAKAYIFGFLWADGTNTIKAHKIKLDVQSSDRDILEKIKTEMQYTGNITQYTVAEGQSYRPTDAIVYRIAIVDQDISQALAMKGFIPHREQMGLPHEALPPELIIDFIRGYFDGNGSLAWKHETHTSTKGLSVNICGGDTMVRDIGDFLTTAYNFTVKYYPRRPENPNNNTLVLTQHADKIAFLDLLYGNPDNLHLDRKFNKYQRYLSEINKCETTIESIAPEKD